MNDAASFVFQLLEHAVSQRSYRSHLRCRRRSRQLAHISRTPNVAVAATWGKDNAASFLVKLVKRAVPQRSCHSHLMCRRKSRPLASAPEPYSQRSCRRQLGCRRRCVLLFQLVEPAPPVAVAAFATRCGLGDAYASSMP